MIKNKTKKTDLQCKETLINTSLFWIFLAISAICLLTNFNLAFQYYLNYNCGKHKLFPDQKDYKIICSENKLWAYRTGNQKIITFLRSNLEKK
jgi:hypothetical protein